jgi:hypothetical protein
LYPGNLKLFKLQLLLKPPECSVKTVSVATAAETSSVQLKLFQLQLLLKPPECSVKTVSVSTAAETSRVFS